jgi:hypothetical protein
MAYFDQARKAERAPAIKAILKKYNVTGSLAVRNNAVFVLNIKMGAIDFIGNLNETVGADPYQVERGFTPAKKYLSVNPYHYENHFSGIALAFMQEVFAAMKDADWYDNSDAQTDYFDTAYYVDVIIGYWNKDYILTA